MFLSIIQYKKKTFVIRNIKIYQNVLVAVEKQRGLLLLVWEILVNLFKDFPGNYTVTSRILSSDKDIRLSNDLKKIFHRMT